jgi:hypothetical protein
MPLNNGVQAINSVIPASGTQALRLFSKIPNFGHEQARIQSFTFFSSSYVATSEAQAH